jgi:hypothetical protein
MKENREMYEQLADRTVQLLAAVAHAISQAGPEKFMEMKDNVQQLLMCVIDNVTSIPSPDGAEQRAP